MDTIITIFVSFKIPRDKLLMDLGLLLYLLFFYRKHNLESYPKYQCINCGFLCDSIDDHKEVVDCKQINVDLFINNLMKTTLIHTKNGKKKV